MEDDSPGAGPVLDRDVYDAPAVSHSFRKGRGARQRAPRRPDGARECDVTLRAGKAGSLFPTSMESSNAMVNYLELPVGDRAPEVFRAVIEIPLDGTQKFEYDKQLHVFKLDRNLHSPVHYPGDYGFIPSTLSDDGDPLDVLVLVPGPSFPGCVQEVRPIGLLEMLDQGALDEKVLAVGKNNPRFSNIWNYTDIYPHMLKEITHFFSIYKDLEGKRVEMKGWHDAAYARDRVVYAIKQFQEKK